VSDAPTPATSRRALLWVGGGVLAFALAVFVIAPELVLGDSSILREALVVIALAAVPGLALLGIGVARRRRQRRDARPGGPTDDPRS
jgi:hypothetical protein